MQVGVFLAYYPSYYEESISTFKKLLSTVSKDYVLIVVANNSEIKVDKNVDYFIRGTNPNSEFHGYQDGVDLLKNLFAPIEIELVIFANDTFCKHRKWTEQSNAVFATTFQLYNQKDGQYLVGECDKIKDTMVLDGCRFKSWVSSYLFGITYGLIAKSDSFFVLPDGAFTNVVARVTEDSIEWSSCANNELKKFVGRWMDPRNKAGWYARASSVDRRYNKLKSILSEYFLTVNVLKSGGQIVDVYSSLPFHSSVKRKLMMYSCKIKNILF